MAVTIPTNVPVDSWLALTTGQISPSAAISIPNASYLAPVSGQNGLVGPSDGVIAFLAGSVTELDGGQRWLMWVAGSLAPADGVNVFNPYVVTGTLGRWISTTIGQQINGVTFVTSGATFTIPPINAPIVNVIVNKTVGSATTVTLPFIAGNAQEFRIKDGKGDAGTNPITISGGARTIDGKPSIVIAVNGGAALLVFDGTIFRQMV